MKGSAALSFGIALLFVSCSVPLPSPAPTYIVTVKLVTPLTPTLPSQMETPVVSSPTPTPSNRGAISFDGVDDYIRVEEDASLDLPKSFSIAAWIYLEEYTEWASLVTKGDKPNLNNYAIQQSGPNDPSYKTQFGRLRFSGCAGLFAPLPESQTVLSLRTWHFVAVTFDASRINFYLNGMPDGSMAVAGPLCTNDEALYFGVDFPPTTEYWHDAIDELRIWNSTLSESQIRDVMNGNQAQFDSALVGYWAFDEGSGSMAYDRSIHANHGLLVGNPVWINKHALHP